jgi:diguanylate cyclase (GGDEF)-like protein
MELLLWRWSTAVQFASLLMLAAFFLALARSSRRAEVRWWVLAWAANMLALGIVVFYWYVQPASFVGVVNGAYVAAKLAFVLLLIQGAWALARPGVELMSTRTLITTTLAYGFVGGLFLRSIPAVGVVQHLVMGVALLGAAAALWRDWHSIAWLASGLVLRGLLALVETAAYWVALNGGVEPAFRDQVNTFLSVTSSFDVGAEWFLALGCVLAVADRAERELTRTNQNLLFAQEHLRRLADRDPLTALDNRRALPEVFRAVQPDGAVLLFFDLDDFKQINDRHGHAVGDRCLKRFAVAVRESFRPSDAVIRYGGDEFLVVATGLDRAAALDRVDRLRVRLTADLTGEPRIRFSCGVAELSPGGSPDAALHAADRAMYASKPGV